MRLTIDFDNSSERKAREVAALLRSCFGGRVELFRSASGRHFHIIAHGLCGDFYEAMLFRWWFGDDRRRMEIDAARHGKGVCTDVLFTTKLGRHAEKLLL